MEKLPFTEEKPWGWFRTFALNEVSTVKLLFIKKGEVFSLQKHQNRDEFWRVLVGNPEIVIGERTISAKPADEFVIDREVEHRIHAPTNDVEVLEISRGEFDENDNERIEDKYGRT